jgi:hypothetical protein
VVLPSTLLRKYTDSMKRHRPYDDAGRAKEEVDADLDASSSEDDDYDDDRDAQPSKKRSSKEKKRKKRKKSDRHNEGRKKHKESDRRHRRRHEEDNDHESSSEESSFSSSSSDEGSRSRKRRKREKKEKRKKHKKSERRSHKAKKRESKNKDRDDDEQEPNASKEQQSPLLLQQNGTHYRLARALCTVLENKPDLASELPIILIRLAGGASFDLSQMTDSIAARGLHSIFETLQEFGVQQNPETGVWMFQSPAGGGSVAGQELVLLRVIRALLNDVGVTMEAMQDYETTTVLLQQKKIEIKDQLREGLLQGDPDQEGQGELQSLRDATHKVLEEFDKSSSTLANELRDLCTSIAQGECISLEDLPDPKLANALETIFTLCGLELSEMVDEDDDEGGDNDDDKDEDSGPTMGYGLPESNNGSSQLKLAAVMQACRTSFRSEKKPVVGPQRGPLRKEDVEEASSNGEDDDSDEGPSPLGAERRRPRGPAMHPDLVKAQAQEREMQLRATVAGDSTFSTKEGEREEWMLVPGQHDFLSTIKSGQAITSRGFQNKKVSNNKKSMTDGDDFGSLPSVPMHPAVQAEIDAILQAHADARGPSLIEQHRAKRHQEKQQKAAAIAAAGGKSEWKWNRDNDLDAGRRVDKDALHLVLGGAADNLKDKFQGGFRR